MTESTFALLRTQEGEFDRGAAARTISPLLGRVTADLIAHFGGHPGILVEGLSHDVAEACGRSLAAVGIPTAAIPESDLVDPPAPTDLKELQILENGFRYTGVGAQAFVEWTEVIWLDMTEVQEVLEETYDDIEIGDAVSHVQSKRHVSDWPIMLRILSYEPWKLFRIRPSRFAFGKTGLSLHANRRKNLVALALAIASRAPNARTGPGMQWFDGGGTFSPERVQNARVDAHLVRWRLTKVFQEGRYVDWCKSPSR